MKRIMRCRWFAFVGLVLLAALCLQAATAVAAQSTDSIRLPITFIQSHPVTTITVGGQTIQAIVDTSAGDVDGALTLAKEIIESAGGVSRGTAVMNEFTVPRFRVPVVSIGGH